MGIKLNLERGFRRITWIISLGLFTVSALVTFFEWQTAKTLWNSAGESQPKGKPFVVYEIDQVIHITSFSEDFTAKQIKESLDKEGKQSVVPFAESLQKKHLTVRELLDATPEPYQPTTREKENLRDIFSYIYQFADDTHPSALYTQKVILQAEAQGTLSPEVETIVAKLRSSGSFPSPISEPFARWSPFAVFTLGATLAPWIFFFLIRWIVRGFRADEG